MAPVYADHPFRLLESPLYRAKKENPNLNMKEDEVLFIASEMCIIHSLIIRALNSIYLQAPHIRSADEQHFAAYMKAWCVMVLMHHHEEETSFFPWIEELTGKKGLMENNLAQHKVFHGGLDVFTAYVDELMAGRQKYDGTRVIELIDAFGQVLTEHLSDEIPTLLALGEYREIFTGKDSLIKKLVELGQDAMGSVTISHLGLIFANVDVEYEGGIWKHWPPAPGIVKLIVRWMVWPFITNLAKFGASDKYGRLKPLYAVPDEK